MTIQALPERLPALPPGGALRVVAHASPETLAATWSEAEKSPLASLHQGLDWCRCWMAANQGEYVFLEGLRDGQPLFILPLEIVRGVAGRVARFVAADYANINTGLFAGNGEALDPVAMREAIAPALAGRVDLLSLGNVPLQWRESLSPLSTLPFVENQNRAFQMPLKSSFEETLKQVNAKRRRKKFRLQQRRLEEAGGYDLVQPQDAAGRHALLDEFFRQKAERFRSQGLPDVFSESHVQTFFHALLDLPEAQDRYALRLDALQMKDGTVLAIAGTSRKGDHVICQFGSIRDDLIPEASPGEFLFWHVIEAACRDGAALFDFGIGDQVYKRSWCTVETVHYDVLLPLTLRGRIAAGLHRAAARTKAAIKANPKLYASIQRLRAGPANEKSAVAATADED